MLLGLICAQATLTASTSFSFGSTNDISFDTGSTPYTQGVWTEKYFGTVGNTDQQIVCVVAVADITNVCGSPGGGNGPGSAQTISVPVAPSGSIPTSNYLLIDGDPQYGAPVWTQLSGLSVGGSYTISFYQASDEEDRNSAAYTNYWDLYLINGTTPSYICWQSYCSTLTTQTTSPSSPTFTSAAMVDGARQATSWAQQSYTFTATAANEVMEFVTNVTLGSDGSTPTAGSFAPPLLDLADVTLTQNSTSPEPGTGTLAITGLVLLLAASCLRRRFAATKASR